MPIVLALIAFAGLVQAVEWDWIAPRTALGGFVVAALLLAAGMFDGRGMGGRDETAEEDAADQDAHAVPCESIQAADLARAEDRAGGVPDGSDRGGFGAGGLGLPPRRAVPRE